MKKKIKVARDASSSSEKTSRFPEKNKKEPKRSIIDVRRPDEFAKGHAEGSVNIPLQEIPERLNELKKIKVPIVVVCGGGTRHIKAFDLLKANGIDSKKGGSWKDMEIKK